MSTAVIDDRARRAADVQDADDIELAVYAIAVDAAIALLDRKLGPAWVHRVDLDTFDIGNPCRCVLGQVVMIPPGEHTEYHGSGYGYACGSDASGYRTLYLAAITHDDMAYPEETIEDTIVENVWPFAGGKVENTLWIEVLGQLQYARRALERS